jgi:hypothetical protein
VINPHRRRFFIESAALAHLGERQTEVHFKSSILCDFWRYCVRSTEAASINYLLLFVLACVAISMHWVGRCFYTASIFALLSIPGIDTLLLNTLLTS